MGYVGFVNKLLTIKRSMFFFANFVIMEKRKAAMGEYDMYGKAEIRDFLNHHHIDYRWIEHKPVFTIDEVSELGLENMNRIVKNLFLRDQKGKRHFLIVIQGNKKADLKQFGKLFETGALSFASEERLQKFLGVAKGSVTPLGILNDLEHAVEVIIDNDLLEMTQIGVHPNENTASVFLKPTDLLEIIKKHGNDIRLCDFV